MLHKQRFMTRPLFQQVHDEIAARITRGDWKPGTMLPNEGQLATELGVSQGTVRKALDMLEGERMLDRKQGRGTFVINHDSDEMSIRFSSIFDSDGQRITGAASWRDAELGQPSAEERTALKIAEFEPVMKISRIRAYHDRPYMYEVAALAMRHFPGLTVDTARTVRLSALAQQHGVHLSHAREMVSPILCSPEIAAKLSAPAGEPILLLRRVRYRMDGTAVEYRTAWCYLNEKHYVSVTT